MENIKFGDFTIIVGNNRKKILKECKKEFQKDLILYIPSQKSLVFEGGLSIHDFNYFGDSFLEEFNEKVYSYGNPYYYFEQYIGSDKNFSSIDFEEKEYLTMKMCGKLISKQVSKGLVIIEDPEIALSQENIMNILLNEIVGNMISLGNKVIISTTSTVFLEFVWILKSIRNDKIVESMYKFFGIKDRVPEFDRVFDYLRSIDIKVYSSKDNNITDISSLNALDDNVEVSEWGGLLSISSKSTEIVSKFNNYN